MAECLVVFASLNQVSRIKRKLQAAGVYVDMIRAPKCLAVQGCGFALRCDRGLLAKLLELSREVAIEIQGVYLEDPGNGSPNYTALSREDPS